MASVAGGSFRHPILKIAEMLTEHIAIKKILRKFFLYSLIKYLRVIKYFNICEVNPWDSIIKHPDAKIKKGVGTKYQKSTYNKI